MQSVERREHSGSDLRYSTEALEWDERFSVTRSELP
jgi:hypothetical protein